MYNAVIGEYPTANREINMQKLLHRPNTREYEIFSTETLLVPTSPMMLGYLIEYSCIKLERAVTGGRDTLYRLGAPTSGHPCEPYDNPTTQPAGLSDYPIYNGYTLDTHCGSFGTGDDFTLFSFEIPVTLSSIATRPTVNIHVNLHRWLQLL